MEYKIIASEEIVDFTRTVNAVIRRGWLPQGGVGVAVEEGHDSHTGRKSHYSYYQAMVRDTNMVDVRHDNKKDGAE